MQLNFLLELKAISPFSKRLVKFWPGDGEPGATSLDCRWSCELTAVVYVISRYTLYNIQ